MLLGARSLNFGGGVAIQISKRPKEPGENGADPVTLSVFPFSVAAAIFGCMTLAVRLRWARHSAIDHFSGAGRCVICSGVRPLTNSRTLPRISLSSSLNWFEASVTAVYPFAFLSFSAVNNKLSQRNQTNVHDYSDPQ